MRPFPFIGRGTRTMKVGSSWGWLLRAGGEEIALIYNLISFKEQVRMNDQKKVILCVEKRKSGVD